MNTESKIPKRLISVLVAAGGLIVGLAILPSIDNSASGDRSPEDQQQLIDKGAIEKGTGETLIIVIAGGVYETAEAAQVAESEQPLGEFQGFYIDQTANFRVLGSYLPSQPLFTDLVCTPEIGCGGEGSGLALGERFTTLQPQELRRLPTGAAAGRELEGRRAECSAEGLACPSVLLGAVAPSNDWEQDGWIRLSAFRTRKGAEQFYDLVVRNDIDRSDLTVLQVINQGDTYVGLGQEQRPDGKGTLDGPLKNQALYQK